MLIADADHIMEFHVLHAFSNNQRAGYFYDFSTHNLSLPFLEQNIGAHCFFHVFPNTLHTQAQGLIAAGNENDGRKGSGSLFVNHCFGFLGNRFP